MAPFTKVMPVIGMNNGFLGNFTRTGERVIAARPVLSTTPTPIYFADPVVIVPDATGGSYQSVRDFIAGGGTMTAARFAGIAHRIVKTQVVFPMTPGVNMLGQYIPGEIAEVGERGSMLVACNAGGQSCQTQSPVFLRIAYNAAFPSGVVGGLEAAADGANTIDLSTVGVVWRLGVIDPNGSAEITMRNRVAA